MPSSFEFRGLQCFAPRRGGEAWTFCPAAADLQRGDDGRVLLSFIDLGPSAYLMFTARWPARAADLEALRREIENRSGTPAALAYAPLEAVQCDVHAGASRACVGTSATSGMPPYDATFNLFLQGEALGAAHAALRGERGHVSIDYRARRIAAASGRATFRARLERLLPFLRERFGGLGDLAGRLEEAVAHGAAAIFVDAPGQDASALTVDLYHQVLARAAERIAPMLDDDATGDLLVHAMLDRDIPVPIQASADLGALLAAEPQGTLIGGHHAAD